MKAVILASLVLAASASAARADSAKCTKGKEWLALKRDFSKGSSDKDGGHAALFSVTLWEGGAWERTDTDLDKPKAKPVTTTGCLKATEKTELTDAFATKPKWETREMGRGSCENRGAWTHEIYSVSSQVVFTREMCGNESLDPTSEKVVEAMYRVLAALKS